MSDISTLIPDIQEVLTTPQGEQKAWDMAVDIASTVGHRMQRALNREDRVRKPGVLFPSELGHPCLVKTWYDFNGKGEPEVIGPATRLKFAYGDIIEALMIPLVKAAGHDVTMVDEKVVVPLGYNGWEISGRIDMVVDGHVVDVKSMAARSFDRWASEGIKADGFGYSAQVETYKFHSGLNSGMPGYILAVDKEGGKLALVETLSPPVRTLALKRSLEAEQVRPTLASRLSPVPEGKSGNMKLAMPCSYCKHKVECWQDANGGRGLRQFNYSYGPVFFTEIAKEPRVDEVK